MLQNIQVVKTVVGVESWKSMERGCMKALPVVVRVERYERYPKQQHNKNKGGDTGLGNTKPDEHGKGRKTDIIERGTRTRTSWAA